MIYWIRHIPAADDGEGIETIIFVVVFGLISLIGALSQALAKSRQKREQQKRGLQPGGAQPSAPAPKPATVDEFLEQIKRMARGEDVAGARGDDDAGMRGDATSRALAGAAQPLQSQKPSTLQRPAPPPPPRPTPLLQAKRPGVPPPPPRPVAPRPAGLQTPSTPPSHLGPARPDYGTQTVTPTLVDRPAGHRPPESAPSLTRTPTASGPPKPAALTQMPRTGPPKRRKVQQPEASAKEAKGKRPMLSGTPAQLRAALRARLAAGPAAMREAVLLSEVLGQPISMRRGRFRRPGMPGRLF
ncbi:MAG: hypothetical protein JW889_15715 [Verrucomicrobia bacterium]|nr:hypothetical protein [Verrucomicrobiota bacterium]